MPGYARTVVRPRLYLDDGHGRSAFLTVSGSGVEQRHAHQFGGVREDGRHRTWFAQAALAVPRGTATYIAGAVMQQESYASSSVAGFDDQYNIPAVFAQLDVDVNC